MTELLKAEEPRMEYLLGYGGQFARGRRSLDGYQLYAFDHLDELTFMRDAAELPAEVVDRAKEEFLGAGWEGDGKLQIAWIPPFADRDADQGRGAFVIHVKQSNNGTSWILSPIALPCGTLIHSLEGVVRK